MDLAAYRIIGPARRKVCEEKLELVDMTAEAIRRRLAHGNIYKPEKIDAALANYFRPGNLGALEASNVAVVKALGLAGLEEAQRRIRSGRNDRLAACVTFDDGYAENCDQAIPFLLEEEIERKYASGKPDYLIRE